MTTRFPLALAGLLLALLLAAGNVAAQGYKPSGVAAAGDTLVFGIHPYTNPQDLFDAYEPVMRYLERKIPGTRFQVEASKDYADYEAKLVAGRFHFSMPNPAQTLLGIEHGYRVIAKMKPDEDFRGLIVARAERNIQSPKQLKGQTVCFPSATAVAGTMLPLLWLHEHGVDVKRDIQVRYVGSQFSSILNAYANDAYACGSTSRFFRTWAKENPEKAKEMQVLWRTEPLPHNGIVARKDVDERLAGQVAQALAAMEKEVDQSQFKIDQAHFELASDKTYEPMRDFLRRYDQAIGLPASMRLPK